MQQNNVGRDQDCVLSLQNVVPATIGMPPAEGMTTTMLAQQQADSLIGKLRNRNKNSKLDTRRENQVVAELEKKFKLILCLFRSALATTQKLLSLHKMFKSFANKLCIRLSTSCHVS